MGIYAVLLLSLKYVALNEHSFYICIYIIAIIISVVYILQHSIRIRKNACSISYHVITTISSLFLLVILLNCPLTLILYVSVVIMYLALLLVYRSALKDFDNSAIKHSTL